MEEKKKKGVAILGSTGSIGTQALEVIQQYPDEFSLEVITGNSNIDLLAQQARTFDPNVVIVADKAKYNALKSLLADTDVKVFAGEEAILQAMSMNEIDVVLTAMVGYAGLLPTIAAIEAGKNIALANKETLVVAGEIITQLAQQKGVNIYPVDSEHSAIFQCLVGEFHNPIEKIYLTASGGPFRGKSLEQLKSVTKAEALRHPNWSMGEKITIDSATMMNKGLEVIEAKWLFGLKLNQIEVVVHPQSIIHSMVQFRDGSIKAQMGLPDMKLPIQFALTYPDRFDNNFERFDFMNYPNLSFESVDTSIFKNLALAYQVLEKGGNAACILNAANEITVQAFLEEKITFLDIANYNERCLETINFIPKPSLDDYIVTNTETRKFAQSLF